VETPTEVESFAAKYGRMQMTQIKRYALYGEQRELKQHSKGSLVLFSDHQKAMYEISSVLKIITSLLEEWKAWKLEAKQKLKDKFNVSYSTDKFIDEVFGK